jgi:CRISPR-associated endonuclease/helicase Cas3
LHTYAPETCRPYNNADIEAAISFLIELGVGDVSQRQMAQLLESLAPDERSAEISGSFLDGGYYATPGDFREIEEFTHPCILDCDLDVVRKLKDKRDPYDGYVINLPKKYRNVGPDWLPRYLGVANSEFYSQEHGFLGDNE